MLKKIKILNSLNKKLVGDFYDVNTKNCVILVHGFLAGRKWNGRFEKFAKDLNLVGISVLSFDLTGYGDSDNEMICVESGVNDLKSIIEYCESLNFENIGIVAHSLGSLITLKQNFLNFGNINKLCLLGGVTDRIHYSFDKRFGKLAMFFMRKMGYFKMKGEAQKGYRKMFKISAKLECERMEVNQKELLSKIKMPVLLIHGDKDNLIPLIDSQNAVEILGLKSKLEIIKNEGHFFDSNLDKVSKLIVNWFKK